MIGITRADGTVLRIAFDHKQHTNKKGERQQAIAFIRRQPPTKPRDIVMCRAITYCYLETGDRLLPVRLAMGFAACVWDDRNPNETSNGFTKAEGRERALNRMLANALKEGVITQDEVGPLRASYYNRARNGAHKTTKQLENTTNGN